MQQSTETIDIGAWRRLGLAILFGCGISWRAKGDGILQFSGLEATRNAKVDEIEFACRCTHNIGGFEVTKDDNGFTSVQIVKNGTEPNTEREDLVQ